MINRRTGRTVAPIAPGEERKLPTPEEWKEIEEKLEQLYWTVDLRVDGYDVHLELKRVGTYRNAVIVYINGWFKGEWLMNDCEERRRFCRCTMHPAFTKKWNKGLSKKAWKKIGIDIDKKIPSYSALWSSFKGLKAHLLKNNKDIEWINKSNNLQGN